MMQRIVARGIPGGVIGMAAGLLLILGIAPTALAGQFAPGVEATEEPRGTEIPAEKTETPDQPTETPPTQTPNDGSGGVVPTPTEVDHDGVAPGQVDLVITTSDGGMLPAGTTACVGEVCQTLSTDTISDFKWRFERMKVGWQEIRVRGANGYDGAVSSVRVAPGQLVRANVEIVRTSPRSDEGVGNNPPPSQDGPPREPNSGSSGSGSAGSGGGNDTANPEGTQRFAQVTDLPDAGSGTGHQSLTLIALAIAASIVFAVAAMVRQASPRDRQ